MTDTQALIANLRSSARAFRENTVYDSEGDPIRLIVQADECDQAATAITEAEAKLAKAREALKMSLDEWDADEPNCYIIEAARACLAELGEG